MKKRTRILALLLAVMLVSVLAACGGGSSSTAGSEPASTAPASSAPADDGGEASEASTAAPSGDLPVINGVFASLAQDYYHMMEYGAYCGGEDFGADISCNGPSVEGDVTVMISMIEDAITMGSDAVLVTPWETELMVQPAKDAFDKGIPFVVLDTELTGEGQQYRSVAIGVSGQYEAAEIVADYIQEQFPDGGKIAIIRGLAGTESHTQRTNGVAEPLEATGKWEVVDIQPADSDRGKGTTVAENFMQSDSEIDVIYATNDEMALGAYAAVEASGNDIACIGFDATTDALKSIIDGKLKASLAQEPLMIGYRGVDYALQILGGAEPTSLEGVDENGYYGYTPEVKDATSAQEYLDSIQGEWDRGKALKDAKA